MLHPGRPAFVLGPGGGRSIDLGNFAVVLKATADDTGATFSLLEAAEPGFGPPLHIHRDADEAFYVLAGESDAARLEEIALRYGMEVVGPVPEGYP